MDDKSSAAVSALPEDIIVGVVGAGAMGAGIAQVAALAGHPVRLFDSRAGAARAAIDKTLATLDQLVAKDRLSAEAVGKARGALVPVDSLEELAPCGLVVEAIIESLAEKRALFESLQAVVGPDALLASNTSSISITAIGSALRDPARLGGMHFFNPAPLMPLVEIISGAATSPHTAQTLRATALRWGKVPVLAKSTPGFIVNRVARPFYAEALRVLGEGASDCATIDAVLRESGGFRMGAFELMDLIGHDVNYAVTRTVFEAFYADRRFTPSLLQLELVEAGFLGRKTGKGFYTYGDRAPVITPSTLPTQPPPEAITLFGEHPLSKALAQRFTARKITFVQQGPEPDGRIAEAGNCTLFLSDGRTATARAHSAQSTNIVLIDLAMDYARATRLAIAAADQADHAAAVRAGGLLQAAGYVVSRVDDIPGLIVLRTMAMLANEAADAVQQGVCTAEDCDLAMRKGVNYPQGPLDWADRHGIAQVVATLDHLRAAYGEGRYRVSPALRRKALASGRFRQAHHGEANGE